MLIYPFLLLCFIIITHSAYSQKSPQQNIIESEKVNVTVFYETLCYQSIGLIHRQLYPTWLIMKQYFNLIFIPYGKSIHNKDRNGRIHFLCHHGFHECYGNLIQACALTYLNMQSAVTYVACFMSHNNNYPFNNDCFEEVNNKPDDVKRFNACVNTTEGIEVLAKLGDLTMSVDPRFTSVPAITFNGVYDIDVDHDAHKNFRSTLCRIINNPEIDACANTTNV